LLSRRHNDIHVYFVVVLLSLTKPCNIFPSGHEFPYSNPREAFDAVDVKRRGELEKEDVAKLMREMDKDYTDDELEKMMETLDLNHSGRVTFDEFKKVFIGDIRTTQSM
jgi:hypothetical protein